MAVGGGSEDESEIIIVSGDALVHREKCCFPVWDATASVGFTAEVMLLLLLWRLAND